MNRKIEKMRVALEAVQHYLLTVPEGAHKDILYQIDEALKEPNMKILGEIDSQGIKWSPTKPPRFVNADAEYADANLQSQCERLSEEVSKIRSLLNELLCAIDSLPYRIEKIKNEWWLHNNTKKVEEK